MELEVMGEASTTATSSLDSPSETAKLLASFRFWRASAISTKSSDLPWDSSREKTALTVAAICLAHVRDCCSIWEVWRHAALVLTPGARLTTCVLDVNNTTPALL